MSEVQQEMSFLDQMQHQLNQFITQRDNAQTNLQQFIGAIYATELAINNLKAKESIGPAQIDSADRNGLFLDNIIEEN